MTALAYFLTFTTYGTWLHGTEKGLGSVDRHSNVYGHDFVTPDPQRASQSQERMSQPIFVLSEPERRIVCEAIVSLASERQWNLLAVHVRTNHVHVVIRAEREPSRILSEFKARASKDLTLAGFDNVTRKRWTRHGSTIHLFDETVGSTKDSITHSISKEHRWHDFQMCRSSARKSYARSKRSGRTKPRLLRARLLFENPAYFVRGSYAPFLRPLLA